MPPGHRHPPHDSSYPPARGPVLLLTCMDLRLLDEIVAFMDHDGLVNRYDHVIMAGAALGALGANLPEYEHWKCTFFDHLDKAYKLHHIHDVYILEHRDCGAYRDFLQEAGDFDEGQEKAEFACHRKYANQLRREILAWAKERDIKLRVRAFLMDLRGRVAQLEEPRQNRKPKRKRAES